MIALLVCRLAWAQATPPLGVPPPPASATERLREARAAYEYGNYAAAVDQLEAIQALRELSSTQDQIEAYRLLGLSKFFLKDLVGARRALLNLLSLDPDLQLDPLYVPPPAIAFFDGVRQANQALLEPIRERRQATQQAIEQEAEARQRMLLSAGVPQGSTPATIIRERTERPSPVVALLPFGIGQFQNGNTGLGIAFAVTEALTLGTSLGSYLWVESQRLPNGNYAPSVYPTAVAWRDVQLGTGVGFLALWLVGAGEALWTLKPPTVIREEVPASPAKPSAPAAHLGAALGPTAGGWAGTVRLDW